MNKAFMVLNYWRCCLLLVIAVAACSSVYPGTASCTLQLYGTRSWIRVQWPGCFSQAQELAIYWSNQNRKPSQPQAVVQSADQRYYIDGLAAQTQYYVWVESRQGSGTTNLLEGKAETILNWVLVPEETERLDIPSSKAVPAGMKIFWHDEFNDALLNRNKWSTNYYSSIDFLYKTNRQELLTNDLPQAAYRLNGSAIDLFTNDSLPVRVYDKNNNKKISSIQTYDWVTNENLLDNSRGGYFEARVKRNSTGKPRGLNTAFWFDSPGPDLRYYLEQGTELEGVKGIRPKGQVFEIDVFEYLNAQFVLHGHVDKNGKFQRNLATHIAEGYKHVDNWVVHGMLWTPTSLKHYINGELIKEYSDKKQLYAPNHFMNVFLGSYGGGGTVNMEVDYIRGYQWPLEGRNELPNGGVEYTGQLLPWEGTGTVEKKAARSGARGILLQPGQDVYQYLYLDHSSQYQLSCWAKGKSSLHLELSNIQPVSGMAEDHYEEKVLLSPAFRQFQLQFPTGKEHAGNTKIVKLRLVNIGKKELCLDDVELVKQ